MCLGTVFPSQTIQNHWFNFWVQDDYVALNTFLSLFHLKTRVPLKMFVYQIQAGSALSRADTCVFHLEG